MAEERWWRWWLWWWRGGGCGGSQDRWINFGFSSLGHSPSATQRRAIQSRWFRGPCRRRLQLRGARRCRSRRVGYGRAVKEQGDTQKPAKIEPIVAEEVDEELQKHARDLVIDGAPSCGSGHWLRRLAGVEAGSKRLTQTPKSLPRGPRLSIPDAGEPSEQVCRVGWPWPARRAPVYQPARSDGLVENRQAGGRARNRILTVNGRA